MTHALDFVRFAAANGSHLTNDEAAVIGKRFEKIRSQNGGDLDEHMVLNDAKDPKSPLHAIWEKHWGWDVNKAAEERWLDCARYLIRSVKIQYLSDGEPIEIRAQIHLADTDTHIERYIPANTVLTVEDYRRQMVVKALKELDSWAGRYGAFKDELQVIFEALNKAKKKFE
jgi:hypothetical protein